MTDETMTTKLRQAEAALLALAEKLGVSMDSAYDAIEIGHTPDGWSLWILGEEKEILHTGKTLEECYLKLLDEEVPF